MLIFQLTFCSPTPFHSEYVNCPVAIHPAKLRQEGFVTEQKDGPWIAVVILENSLLDGQLIARDSQLIQRNIYSTIFRMKCFKIIWTWSCLQKMLIKRICYHCLFWHFYLFKKRVISVFHFSGNKHCLIVHLYRKWNTHLLVRTKWPASIKLISMFLHDSLLTTYT